MANIFGKPVSAATLAKAGVLLAVAVYFWRNAADRVGYHFLDNVDLAIHEAGHIFFAFGGEFIGIAGGTILQLAMPFAFAFYFFRRADRFAAGITMFWLGQSFINVARYAGDAQKMELPLLGGGVHDWNYLLGAANLLPQAGLVSDVFYYLGIAIIVAGAIVGLSSFSNRSGG